MMQYFKKLSYLFVFIGFSVANAGSFEDFFAAIKRDNASDVRALLQRGFDGNTSNEQGLSGLFLAIKSESYKAADALLDWPQIAAETRNPKDESALMIAALAGELDLCKKLIDKGADVNKVGWAPLHYAATRGQVAVMRLLLDNDAYIDAASPNGTTPLMMAARYGSTDSVRLLLDEGADPLLKNQQQLSAIDFAQLGVRPDAVAAISAAVRAKQPKGAW